MQVALGTSGLLQRNPAAGARLGSAITIKCPKSVPMYTIPLLTVGCPSEYVAPDAFGTSISHLSRSASAAHTLNACNRLYPPNTPETVRFNPPFIAINTSPHAAPPFM